MLEAYWDESESHQPSDVYAVVACVSTVDRWLAFKKAWTKALPPSIAVFHSTEWARGERGFGPYADLKPKARRALGRKLYWLIRTHTVHCVTQPIPVDTFRVMVERHRKGRPTIYTDPYLFSMYACLARIHVLKQAGRIVPNEPVRCFFERRDKKRDRRLERQYDRMTGQWFVGGFGTKVVGPKDDPALVPLQAADFLAYQTMRIARSIRRRDGSKDPLLGAMAREAGQQKWLSGGDLLTPALLEKTLAGFEESQARIARGEIEIPPYPKKGGPAC